MKGKCNMFDEAAQPPQPNYQAIAQQYGQRLADEGIRMNSEIVMLKVELAAIKSELDSIKAELTVVRAELESKKKGG
jgi:hypothetical protein